MINICLNSLAFILVTEVPLEKITSSFKTRKLIGGEGKPQKSYFFNGSAINPQRTGVFHERKGRGSIYLRVYIYLIIQ